MVKTLLVLSKTTLFLLYKPCLVTFRTCSYTLFEAFAELENVVVPHHVRHFAHGITLKLQQLFRLLHAVLEQVFARSLLCNVFENLAEIIGRKTVLQRKLRYIYFLIVMLENVFDEIGHHDMVERC